MTIRWFGEEAFGPICKSTPKVDAPVGQPCSWCKEPITLGDEGVMIPSTNGYLPTHRCCFLRQVAGSVGHQQMRCSCYGGTEEDPPNLTKRQAAEAATQLFEIGLHRLGRGNPPAGY